MIPGEGLGMKGLLVIGLVVCGGAYATESTTGMKIEDALKNKTFQEDKRITDIELKAAAGSLSRYSMKFDLSYSGPPVNDLSDPEMPNPDGRSRCGQCSEIG